jgi:hypothetical protein
MQMQLHCGIRVALNCLIPYASSDGSTATVSALSVTHVNLTPDVIFFLRHDLTKLVHVADHISTVGCGPPIGDRLFVSAELFGKSRTRRIMMM